MFTCFHLNFYILCICIFISPNGLALQSPGPSSEESLIRNQRSVDSTMLNIISKRSEDLTVFKRALRNILVPRVVGTESHKKVQNYIIQEFKSLGWHVDIDRFTDSTPIGTLEFSNIIATENPQAESFLVLSCHYDSKYYPGSHNFVGATDSAVPCAMMIHIAHLLQDILEKNRRNDVSLMLVFFDGEEAFKTWTKTDSLYGSRHLAKKWDRTMHSDKVSQLDRIKLFVLLDLLGAKNPEFYSFYPETQAYYKMFANAETKLSQRSLLKSYGRRYFHRKSTDAHIQDDHIPFLELGVPIVHLITVPFPPEWHTFADNWKVIDFPTTLNLIKIVSIFVVDYLNLSVV